MQATFNESDIQSLLTKVKIFNHQIGTYELYTKNDSFHYVEKRRNETKSIIYRIHFISANLVIKNFDFGKERLDVAFIERGLHVCSQLMEVDRKSTRLNSS